MKNIFTRLLCMLLCLSLVASFAPAAAAMQEGSGEIVEVSEVIYIDQVDAGASVYSLDGNGNVALKPGNHERWIDRLDLSDAKYALDFYAWLEDNIDGALVDPTRGDVSKDDYLHYVKTNTGKFSFTYDKNAANPADAAAAAAKQTVQYGLPETLKDVKPYLVAAYSAFDRDHPEVFWLTGSCLVGAPVSYSYSYGGGSGTVNYTQRFYFCLAKGDGSFDIRQESYRTAASIEDGVSIRYTATDIILNKVTATDTYGKVRQLNQILTTQNCYNSNVSTAPKSAHECISALTGNTGSAGPVCEGYARAFKVLCDELDIPCVLVDGMSYNSGGSGPHMWNNVQMPDGNWYAVDVTWNDPVVSGKNGAVSGYENENYLLVGANTMVSGMYFSASHEVQNTVTNGGTWFTNGPVLENGAYIPATGLTISRSTLDLKEGELIVLTVAVVPSNATGEAIWSSDNPSVVTVDCGVVKAVSAGKAVITARVGEISAQCVVTVEHIHGYAGVITTQPTCTNVGVMTYSCSCGDSYTEAIPVTDHSYVNGTCTACGAYEAPVLKDGYYEIATANQLYWFAQRVSSGYTHINGKLVADITINTGVLKADGTLNGDGSNFRVWTPIGVSSNYYQGTFDGDGHTVSGVYYVSIEDVGFFSRTNGATIQNLHIADSYFRGQTYVGAVIGTSYGGTVIGCTSSATVDCGTEYASSMITGGIVGYGDGTVENCENLGLVIGDAQVGGIVGENYGTVKNCVNSGNVMGVAGVGGIAGGNSKTITDCGNTAKITATSDKIGGVVGNNSGTVTFCYNTASVSGSSGVGGVAGNNDRGTITSCYNTSYISGSYAVGGVAGQNKNTISNCYNVGGVKSTSNHAGGVVGKQVSGTVTGCVFRDNCAMDGKNTIQTGFGCDTLGSAAVNQPAQTACYSDFTTGEVAYFLQSGLSEQVWGQNLDNGEDFQGCPCFSDAVVYKVTNCKGETVYSNRNENVPHTYENSVCIVCGAIEIIDSGKCGDDLTWTLDAAGTLTISGTGEMWMVLREGDSSDALWYEYCDRVKSIVVESGVTAISGYAFDFCPNATSIVLPDSVTSIGEYAFAGCSSLTHVTIPKNVTTIRNGTFYGCSGLKTVSIPEGVTSIGEFAITCSTGLENLVLPDSLTSIGRYAFEWCGGVESITIPANVTSIGDGAFRNFDGLKTIWFVGDAPVFEMDSNHTADTMDTFRDVTATAYYPYGNKTWTADVMQDYGGNITWVAYGEPEIEKFDITLANLTLGNDLTLYFYIPADACADWTGTYAVVTKPYADGTETATVTVPFESWEPGFKSGGKDLYRVAFNGIAAKEMTDEVTIEIFNAEGKAISNPGKESVRSYLDRFMKANAADATKMRLAIDMLNYGAAAQTHFGYNTENLANADLTAAQKAFGTATAPACVNGNVKGANAKGSNLTLESSILMNFYFNGLTEDMYAVVTFTDHTGASHNEKLGAHDGSRFTVNQVVVADARQLVTVTVYNADGSVYGTCTDSVESYVARARAAQAKGLDLYEAIIKFADSAYEYLHNR